MPLSAPRSTVQSGHYPVAMLLEFPVAAAAKIFQGAIVCIQAGYAIAGQTATGLIAVGIAQETVDNTSGVDGALTIKVRPGVFLLGNYATDPIVQADVCKPCYVFDDYQVAKTDGGGTRSIAGVVLALNPTGYPAGVLVSLGPQDG